jgi:hypothetical protein
MASLDAVNVGVGPQSAGQYRYASNTRTPVLIKNVGTVTAYIGSTATVDNTSTISPNSGYPLLPGESIQVPGLLTSDGYQIAFNTPPNQVGGALRILSLME